MSGLDVIGGISAVITLLGASIRIYDSAQNDAKLSKTFEVVRRRLPVILHILQRCKDNLEPTKDSMPSDVCMSLEKILDSCDEKARKLREIFEKVIPGEKDKWEKRYAKVIRRLGKGNKVEELMAMLTQDVQLLVNNNAVKSATPERNIELEGLLQEMKCLKNSTSEEERTALVFHSGGVAQTNNVNSGSCQQINNAHVGTQIFHSVTFKQKEDFSFLGHVGVRLGQAPFIASELFVGRGSELNKITEALSPDHNAQKQRRLVLGGIGGIGKTQVAIAYAESSRGSYSSVFWLNTVSEVALKESFRSVASLIFDIQHYELPDNKEIMRLIHQWLSDPKNTGWLLIFDNYDDPDQFQIDNYYPPASHGAIIVTTRRPDLVAGSHLHIKPFQKIEDSIAILQTRSKRGNVQADPHAKRLAERLAGLPLALATAGSYLQRSALSFERYLQEYEKLWNVEPRRPTKLKEYQERTLYTTWDVSYSRLEREDPDAARLLKLLAYFDNQSLLHKHFRAGLTTNSPEWLREVITDDVNFNGAMGILTGYYFLDLHPMSESWSMHNCVHDWTLASLNKDIDTVVYWYAFECAAGSITGVDEDLLGHSCYSCSAAHAKRLVHQRFDQSESVSILKTDQLIKGSRISRLLREHVHLEAAERMYLRVLAGHEKALGVDHTSTLQVVDDLGLLYHDQGKLDRAEQMYPRALAGFEKALGSDHKFTLRTISNIGLLYSAQGKLDQAEQMYLRALAGFEKAFGVDHTFTLRVVNNIGLLYSAQGKLGQAEQMYLRALAGFEKVFKADHTLTLRVVNNIGLLYSAQGKLDQAKQMYLRALVGFEKTLGDDHPSTLYTVNSLGVFYQEQGQLDRVEQMYLRALVGFEKMLGAGHPSTLHTVNNLGNLYADQDKPDEAEQMYLRALVGFEKTLGEGDLSTLHTINNLGNLYADQDKPDEAEQMYLRALRGREKALGADHVSTLRTVHNLGVLYQDQGKLDEAEQMYLRALTGREKALGADHVSTLRTVHNLGVLYQDQGKLDEAEQMYRRALKGRERALGAGHASTLRTGRHLEILHHDQGQLDELSTSATQ